jgi:2-desacetyl-2-hydroxyethyl bacteriochlorophyllide A dehydrogenase
MQALWLEKEELHMRAVPGPQNPREALIRIRVAGICSTDLELVKGYYPFTGIPGHEFVGEVVQCEEAAWVGQRVVGEINVTCGACESCLHGRPTHCEDRSVLGILGRDGTFAEFTTLPLANLHRVPDAVPDEIAVFTEPLAAALEILEQAHIRPTDRVLLVGAGRLGQLIAQTLALTGCDLRVVARHAHQQKILAARGVKVIADGDVQTGRWDVVVEATGSPAGFELARRALRPRGTLVMKSTYQGELTLDMSSIVVDEVTILGSRCGPFEPALRLLERGEIDPRGLIAAKFPLGEALEAFERAAQPGVLKVLVTP